MKLEIIHNFLRHLNVCYSEVYFALLEANDFENFEKVMKNQITKNLSVSK